MNNEMYTATVGSLLRENARLRGQIHGLQQKIDDLMTEQSRIKASRGAVLKAIDIKGRLKAMIRRATK